MELWKAYEFATFLADYIRGTGDCLYNAMVRRLAVLSASELLAIRGSLYNWIQMIDEELAVQSAPSAEDEVREWVIQRGDVLRYLRDRECGEGPLGPQHWIPAAGQALAFPTEAAANFFIGATFTAQEIRVHAIAPKWIERGDAGVDYVQAEEGRG